MTHFVVIVIWRHCRQGRVDHDFLFHCLFSSHFSLTTFSASSLQFLLSFFCIFPTLSSSLSMQSPSQFRSSSPPFPLHFLGICSLCQFCNWHFFYITSPCTPHRFHLKTFLQSQFIYFLLSALLTPTVILTRLFFANLDLLLYACRCNKHLIRHVK